jgi:hypothetical protein
MNAAGRTLVQRERLYRRVLRLEYFTVGWNVVEAVVAITAGLVAGSVALVRLRRRLRHRGPLRRCPALAPARRRRRERSRAGARRRPRVVRRRGHVSSCWPATSGRGDRSPRLLRGARALHRRAGVARVARGHAAVGLREGAHAARLAAARSRPTRSRPGCAPTCRSRCSPALILGFALSGIVQARITRGQTERLLGGRASRRPSRRPGRGRPPRPVAMRPPGRGDEYLGLHAKPHRPPSRDGSQVCLSMGNWSVIDCADLWYELVEQLPRPACACSRSIGSRRAISPPSPSYRGRARVPAASRSPAPRRVRSGSAAAAARWRRPRCSRKPSPGRRAAG